MGNKQGISEKEAKALTEKTHWTRADLDALAADFKKSDTNKSGELGFAEFCTLLRPRITMDEAGYKNLFHQMDADNSGTVSFAELATSLSVIGKGSADEKLAFTFDLYDADKSGYLDRNEAQVVLQQMKRVAASLGRQADDFIAGMLDKLDVDKDGKITKKEWMEVGARTPSLLVLLGVKKV